MILKCTTITHRNTLQICINVFLYGLDYMLIRLYSTGKRQETHKLQRISYRWNNAKYVWRYSTSLIISLPTVEWKTKDIFLWCKSETMFKRHIRKAFSQTGHLKVLVSNLLNSTHSDFRSIDEETKKISDSFPHLF